LLTSRQKARAARRRLWAMVRYGGPVAPPRRRVPPRSS
jgi:hypothetical protein